ncbi:MAG: hypothetical protein JW941_08670 [Candidatus Coatesbacteria bacterium]|nr:hypothetical protein [Candidatus Coatesbacteria bacterium]
MANVKDRAKNGIVVMLDALGARNMDLADCDRFIKVRDRLVRIANDFGSELQNPGGFYAWSGAEQLKTYTFGDTILLTWDFAGQRELDLVVSLLALMEDCIARVFCTSISLKMPLRGSVSLGQYIEDSGSNTVLGPAVADAAIWYERANWLGVILTPDCAKRIRDYEKKMSSIYIGKNILSHSIVNYAVPLKNGETLDTRVLAWPFKFLTKGYDPASKNAVSFILNETVFPDVLATYSAPSGTELKYENTLAFYDHYRKEYGKQIVEFISKYGRSMELK